MLLAMLVMLSPSVHAQVPSSSAPPLVVPDIPDAEFGRWIAKSNAYVGLLNETLSGVNSWNRYLSWVDLKKGPTGRERIIYGLYSVSASIADRSIAAARKAADTDPPIPALDLAAKEVATSFEALIPILNEAEAYYERKDYVADKMAGGKALHERLVRAAAPFLAARGRLGALEETLKDSLDQQELAHIERTNGKELRWHTRNTMILAKKAIDAMPRDLHKPNIAAFDAAITAYAEGVRNFDIFVQSSGKTGVFDSQPRHLLGSLRELREKLDDRRLNPTFYSMDFNNIVNAYNLMVNMANRF
jgi:hypothetical protein